MATATVEHIYTWNGTGTGSYATYDKTIDIGTVNGVSFAGSSTIYMLETTIVVHGLNTDNNTSAGQVYRKACAVYKDTSNIIDMTLNITAGAFNDAGMDIFAASASPTPITYTNPSTTNIRIRFTNYFFSTTIYYRAICKVIAYKAS